MKVPNERLVTIPSGSVFLEGALELPLSAQGVVLFAHGSGSSRHSPRNNFVAARLREAGLGTLLIDLLTPAEDRDHERRFDIPLLVERLHDAVRWLSSASRNLKPPEYIPRPAVSRRPPPRRTARRHQRNTRETH